MVYSNEYQSIRPAIKADAYAIYNITRNGVKSESLRERSQQSIEATINNFLVYEIDGSIVACLNLKSYDDGAVYEIGSVYVQPFYQNKGVGQRMVECAYSEAKQRGAKRVIAMTTQAMNFFTNLCGFEEGGADDLPEARRAEYQANGRNSKILFKVL